MRCRNGHDIEERIVRSDGKRICPVCHRESAVRRTARYYEGHAQQIIQRRSDRRLFG